MSSLALISVKYSPPLSQRMERGYRLASSLELRDALAGVPNVQSEWTETAEWDREKWKLLQSSLARECQRRFLLRMSTAGLN